MGANTFYDFDIRRELPLKYLIKFHITETILEPHSPSAGPNIFNGALIPTQKGLNAGLILYHTEKHILFKQYRHPKLSRRNVLAANYKFLESYSNIKRMFNNLISYSFFKKIIINKNTLPPPSSFPSVLQNYSDYEA